MTTLGLTGSLSASDETQPHNFQEWCASQSATELELVAVNRTAIQRVVSTDASFRETRTWADVKALLKTNMSKILEDFFGSDRDWQRILLTAHRMWDAYAAEQKQYRSGRNDSLMGQYDPQFGGSRSPAYHRGARDAEERERSGP